MDFNEYQKHAKRTLTDDADCLNMVLGIAGEAGEVADYYKKTLYQKHGFCVNRVIEELGDILWYIANLATMYGVSLEEVARWNVIKLQERYPNGFDAERSVNRG